MYDRGMTAAPGPQNQPEESAPSTTSLREAISALTQALGAVGSEVRKEVVDELRAAATEARSELAAARDEVAEDLTATARELRDDLGSAGRSAARRPGEAARSARQAKAERTRADLLAAAREVFSAKGYEGASVADLAKAAGYTKGALYANFSSKEELFLAVIREVQQETDEVLDGTVLTELPETTEESVNEILLSLEAYLYALRHPGQRDAIADIGARAFPSLARGVRQLRGGSSGDEPTADDVDTAIALAALHTMGGVLAPIFTGRFDVEGALDRMSRRLVAGGTDED